MPIFETIVFAGVIPGAIALAAFLAAQRFLSPPHSHAVGALAAGLAICSGFVLLFGIPPLPVTDVTEWVGWLVVLTALISAVIAYLPFQTPVRYFAAAALAILVSVLVLDPYNEHLWESGNALVWVAGFSLAGLFIYHVIDRKLSVEDCRGNLFLLAVAAMLIVPAFGNSGSIKLMQMAVMLTALIGAVWFARLFFPGLEARLFLPQIIMVVLAAMIISGVRYASLPFEGAIAIAMVFLLPWLISLPEGKLPSILQLLLRLAAIAVLALAALYTTLEEPAAEDETSEDDAYYYEYYE